MARPLKMAQEAGAAAWQLPLPTWELAPGATHLWRARSVPTPDDPTGYAAQLTAAEVARANRFATATLRRRFLQAHALLRTLLAAYTHAGAQPCKLAYHANGKPYLESPQLQPALEFNLSHAGEVICLALGRGLEVGVDVERVRPLDDLDAMIESTCSVREQAHLATLTGDARLVAFYRLWTRKEAWLKLRGLGIGAGLAATDALENPSSVTLLEIALDDMAGDSDGDAYVGTLALPAGADPTICVYDAVWR